MKQKLKPKRTVALLSVLALASTALLASPAAASTPEEFTEISGIETDLDISTEAELKDFLASSAPKTVHVEIDSGEITRVEEGNTTPDLEARTTVRSPCVSGDLCAYAYSTPLADYGFTGTGGSNGSWTNRGYIYTGNWYARIQWENNAYTPTISPQTTVLPDRVPATLTGVVITN